MSKKHEFAIEVLQTRLNEIRGDPEFSWREAAPYENDLTDAIRALRGGR